MYTKEFLLQLYEKLYTIRIFEERCIKLYRQGFIRGYFHPYIGEEAIAVGVCAALESRDYISSTHRGHGHCIARGADLGKMTAELFGKKTGYCKGLGGSMHIADFSAGNLGANGIVGGGLPLGTGAALSASIRGTGSVSVVFASDGASNNGIFMETLNLAAVWNLPLLLVVENNQYAVSTPIEQSTREPDIYKRGQGYGVESFSVDGNDVLEVYERAKESCDVCGNGKGPILMEAKTFRFGGHHINDPGLYMPKEKLDYYKAKDPVIQGKNYAIEKGAATKEDIQAVEEAVERDMEKAVTFEEAGADMTVDEFFEMIKDY